MRCKIIIINFSPDNVSLKKLNVDANTHQQLSFFTADKSDMRVRATTISSVNFTIVTIVFQL